LPRLEACVIEKGVGDIDIADDAALGRGRSSRFGIVASRAAKGAVALPYATCRVIAATAVVRADRLP
jgi:hypothetical protein